MRLRLFIDIIGRPLTPFSYAGVARRTAYRGAYYAGAAARRCRGWLARQYGAYGCLPSSAAARVRLLSLSALLLSGPDISRKWEYTNDLSVRRRAYPGAEVALITRLMRSATAQPDWDHQTGCGVSR